MAKIKCLTMSEGEYRSAEDSFNGFCLSCGTEILGGVEGDARNYECEFCDEHEVFGMLELLLMGIIEID